ncbi:protein-glutamine gamma-glutamyltransferase [Paenibacillus sp. GYB003]|uniref:protein-glutamine gamma-glutamyltransferase n=1 Tax=Paenibacillus sp. GYB003 TaxID=2994392 RepID=UPI002F96C72A
MIIMLDGSTPARPGNLSAAERDVYDQKSRSPTTFRYASEEELLFELRLRAAIVEAAAGLDRSGAGFATFGKSRANRTFWSRMDNGGFLLKSGALPSAAIRDIYANGGAYAFECATAIVIVLYKAVLETIGDRNFNRLFGNLQLYSWEHDSDMPLVTQDNARESFAGDVLYYKNPDYNPKTPEWQGENVVKMPGGKLFGHGIGIVGEAEIIRHLNNHRKPGSQVSAYLFHRTTYPNFNAILYEMRSGTGSAPLDRPWPGGWIAGRIGSRTRLYMLA